MRLNTIAAYGSVAAKVGPNTSTPAVNHATTRGQSSGLGASKNKNAPTIVAAPVRRNAKTPACRRNDGYGR